MTTPLVAHLPAPPVEYKYTTVDAVTRKLLAELDLSNVSMSKKKNAFGDFSAEISLQDAKALRSYLDPARTIVVVERDNQIFWSGPIWSLQKTGTGTDVQIAISASTYESFLTRRTIRETQKWYNMDRFDIARAALRYAQTGTNGDLFINVPDDTIKSGALDPVSLQPDSETAAGNQVFYWYDSHKISDIMDSLTKLDGGGLIWELLPRWDTNNVLVYDVRLDWPTQGRDTQWVFEYGANVTEYGWAVNGGNITNQFDGFGDGQGFATVRQTFTAQPEINFYPRLEWQHVYSPYKDAKYIEIRALRDGQRRRKGYAIPTVSLLPGSFPPLNSIQLGDRATVIIKDGPRGPDGELSVTDGLLIDVNGRYQISEIGVEVTPSGESPTLAFIDDEAESA